MLPLPDPVVHGFRISHPELRALHQNRTIAIHAATARYSLTGPRLLDPKAGERCEMTCHGRDRQGNLLAEVVVVLPAYGQTYSRKIRLVRDGETDLTLRVRVARDERESHT